MWINVRNNNRAELLLEQIQKGELFFCEGFLLEPNTAQNYT